MTNTTIPLQITANGVTWTLLDTPGDGRVRYRRGRTVRSFDKREMQQITTGGLTTIDVKTGERTEWRAA